MPETDWRREPDPRFKYKVSELTWLVVSGFTSTYGVLVSQMVEISGTWTLEY
jgi:hypothetical protein